MSRQTDDEVIGTLISERRAVNGCTMLCLLFLAGVIVFYGVSWFLQR